MPVVSPSMLRLEQASVNNSPGPIYQSRGVSQNFIRRLFCKASVYMCRSDPVRNHGLEPSAPALLHTPVAHKDLKQVRIHREVIPQTVLGRMLQS